MRHSRTSTFIFVVVFTTFCLYEMSLVIVKSTVKLPYRFGARGLSFECLTHCDNDEHGSKRDLLICGVSIRSNIRSVNRCNNRFAQVIVLKIQMSYRKHFRILSRFHGEISISNNRFPDQDYGQHCCNLQQ